MEFENVDTNVKKMQGDVGVARAVYEYTKMGYTVLAPLSDSDKYDLVIGNGQMLMKVQVKTSRCKSQGGENRTGYQVNLSTKGGNTKINTIRTRESTDYDVLFVLVETGDCWSIPTAALGDAKHSICVGSSADKYKQYKL